MLILVLLSKNDLKVSNSKQANAPSSMRLTTYLMNFECHPCEIFEGISHHQEDEAVVNTTFASSVGLGDIINKLLSSKFMGIFSSVSVICDTIAAC